jgi:ferredoxin/flavodoxin
VLNHGKVEAWEMAMTTEVYYFSGTGNSLAVAREIAKGLGGELLSMPAAVRRQRVEPRADCVGLVFPVYLAQLYGVPLIVERFVTRLVGIEKKYIFAVATCGGYESFNALPALKNLAKLVRARGGRIAAEHSVRLPMNNLDYSHIPIPINKDQDLMFERCHRKVAAICDDIRRERRMRYGIAKSVLNWAMTPLYRMLEAAYLKELRKYAGELEGSNVGFRDLIPRIDKSIKCDDQCDGCGTCAQVCPAENIAMSEDRPTWLHHCEMCLACAEWCPRRAVHHCMRADGNFYHHPEVKVSDMLRQARA